MPDQPVEAAPLTQRMTVDVTLLVQHHVRVKVSADSGRTVDQLRDLALEEYHRDPGRYGSGNGRRTDDSWRLQFQNRANIRVGEEEVSIAAIQSTPTDRWSA